MKLIIAFVQPHKLQDVKKSLYKNEVYKISVTNALGCGAQKGYHESYRGVDFEVNLLKKVRLEIAVNEDFVDKTIKAIIDGGLISEEGAFQVVVDGTKDGKPMRITSYVNAPGLIEAFEKSGLTHESYLTGQSAFIFTKMLVNDVIHQTGAIAPEVLDDAARAYFFKEAAKLDITVDRIIE